MNSRQMEYAVALSKVRNFSQVSEQLNISQPALSKQIQSLEKTLGVRIFDRNSTPLELTPAGACFIREAEALLEREKQLKGWRRSKKNMLIEKMNPQWKDLYPMILGEETDSSTRYARSE